LLSVKFPSGRITCGGVIINHRQILTAAHCLVEHDVKSGPDDITVYVGSNKEKEGEEYAVNNVAIHPDYEAEVYINDIALLSLEKSLKFTESIGPACLPRKSVREYIGQGLTVSGWGDISSDGKTTHDLQVVKNIKILEDCEQ
jgi:secreted trypsin-like serine protease